MNNALAIEIVGLVRDELGRCLCQCPLQLDQRVKEQVAAGVIRRRSTRRERTDSLIDFNSYQTARVEESTRKFNVVPEIIVSVETGSRCCRVHYAEASHGVKISALEPANKVFRIFGIGNQCGGAAKVDLGQGVCRIALLPNTDRRSTRLEFLAALER